LSKKLCADPSKDDHWTFRKFSTNLLKVVCKDAPAGVRMRVIKVLSNVFTDANSSIVTIFSAVLALTELGTEVISTVLSPIVYDLNKIAQKYKSESASKEEVMAAEKMIELLQVNFNRVDL
jgi:hypothetical protein